MSRKLWARIKRALLNDAIRGSSSRYSPNTGVTGVQHE